MKTKILLVVLLSLFLLASYSISMAQENIKEEDALAMIEEYKACAEEYGAKIEELKVQVEPLKDAVAELDKKISELETEIAKYTEKEANDYYVVKPGDWMSKLAEYSEVYGHGNYAQWQRIYKANKNLIKNPDLIYPGWKLVIPRP